MEAVVDMDKWQKKKKRIFERDGYRCQKCLKNNVPLMVYVYKFAPNIPIEENRIEDMFTVCTECYRKM